MYIAEKPSVGREFAKALGISAKGQDGYLESGDSIVTWCLGHLVTMSYPEVYDPALKKWSLSSLPFIPEEYRYEVIPSSKKQFKTVAGLLNRPDVDTIYVCTDSGREGEYIYRLVAQEAKVTGKRQLRVWIDSQTGEEILRGIREARPLTDYDHLADAAYLRAKEDYLMGINFSRLLTLKYGNSISGYLGMGHASISVGRVMSCVQGMVVRREREIRGFTETPFYRVTGEFMVPQNTGKAPAVNFEGEWRAVKGSRFYQSGDLYKENGFKSREKAQELINLLSDPKPVTARITDMKKKSEKKYPPLLFNLAELQNTCSRAFKISPDETLKIVQELYEKKLVTYPRTDARVLSGAVAKEIRKNLNGLMKYEPAVPYLREIVSFGSHKKLGGTRYVDDSKITDHYAIIPTGEGLKSLDSLSDLSQKVYDVIVRRFLSIFYPPAVYQKVSLTTQIKDESFFSSYKVLESDGYLKVLQTLCRKEASETGDEAGETEKDAAFLTKISALKKGMEVPVKRLGIKEGKTSPPKRYTSGSLILAMENAGQLIEDEDLREQIKGCGIGTSATRGDILKKLFNNKYLALQKKTQVVSPTMLGEMIYDVVDHSIRSLLNPELTASWEKGLHYVAEGEITGDVYMKKLTDFINSHIEGVKELNNQSQLKACYDETAKYYKKPSYTGRSSGGRSGYRKRKTKKTGA